MLWFFSPAFFLPYFSLLYRQKRSASVIYLDPAPEIYYRDLTVVLLNYLKYLLPRLETALYFIASPLILISWSWLFSAGSEDYGCLMLLKYMVATGLGSIGKAKQGEARWEQQKPAWRDLTSRQELSYEMPIKSRKCARNGIGELGDGWHLTLTKSKMSAVSRYCSWDYHLLRTAVAYQQAVSLS